MTNPSSLPNLRVGIISCLFLTTLVVMTAFVGCQTPDTTSKFDEFVEREAITAVMMRQQDAWNAGEIEAFMDDYVKSDTLRFTSGNTVRYGWETTLQRYYDTYPSREAMGELTFSDLEIDVLSAEWALVFGSWYLVRGGEYENIGGRYTLLLHHEEIGWKILYDHTSQAN